MAYYESTVTVIRPDSILKGRKAMWGIVNVVGKNDVTDKGDYYIVKIDLADLEQVIDAVFPPPASPRVGGADATILLTLSGEQPSYPFRITDNDALNFSQRTKLLKTMPTKELIELVDFLVRANSGSYRSINPKTEASVFGYSSTGHKGIKETTMIEGKGVEQTDTTIDASLGEKIILTGRGTILKGTGAQIQIDNNINISAESQSTTAVDDKKMVNENTLSHFLPETLVTWPASIKWLPALDMIINIGWKLANFLMIIKTTKSMVDSFGSKN